MTIDKTGKSDSDWRKELTPERYRVLRQHGTEAPCASCGAELFPSGTKYESGSGWPSFYAAMPEAVEIKSDTSHGMTRTEVNCARCGGHLGHVFPDGPQPTGERYCINGAALNFKPEGQ